MTRGKRSRVVTWVAIAALGLLTPAAASPQGGRTLPVEAIRQDAILGSDAVTVHGNAPLHVQAGVKVEMLDAQSIRELIDIAVHFSGVDPIDGGQQPVKDMQIEFEIEVAGAVGPPCIRFLISGQAWTAVDGAFEIEVSDPQDLPAVIQVLKVQDGQVVADLTNEIEAVEARLGFLADAKAWSLTLELTGPILPFDGIIGPSMYHPIVGAVTASLELGPDHLPAHVRVGEVRSAGPALEVRAEDEVEPLDEQTIRERVETAYFFTGIDPIDLNAQPARPHDMTIAFDLDPAGSVTPCFLRHIPSSAWEVDRRGGFKFEATDPQEVAAVIQIVVVEDGQVVADLTSEIESVQARLEFLPDAKGWLLRVELTGAIGPSASVTPCFYPMLGAGMVSLEVGQANVSAGIREGEATFF